MEAREAELSLLPTLTTAYRPICEIRLTSVDKHLSHLWHQRTCPHLFGKLFPITGVWLGATYNMCPENDTCCLVLFSVIPYDSYFSQVCIITDLNNAFSVSMNSVGTKLSSLKAGNSLPLSTSSVINAFCFQPGRNLFSHITV